MTASEAITRAIRVKVACEYSAEQHRLVREQFSWIYTIDIENHGSETVQLLNRYWLITDAQGRQEEVRGPGVVGQQPVVRDQGVGQVEQGFGQAGLGGTSEEQAGHGEPRGDAERR